MDVDLLTRVYERAAGVCECIGGGCAALTHRPDVNRCVGALPPADSTTFITVARFADRSDPENVRALCTACAQTPRKNAERLTMPR